MLTCYAYFYRGYRWKNAPVWNGRFQNQVCKGAFMKMETFNVLYFLWQKKQLTFKKKHQIAHSNLCLMQFLIIFTWAPNLEAGI